MSLRENIRNSLFKKKEVEDEEEPSFDGHDSSQSTISDYPKHINNSDGKLKDILLIILTLACAILITLMIIGTNIGFIKVPSQNISCTPIVQGSNISQECGDNNNSQQCSSLNITQLCITYFTLNNTNSTP